MPRAIVGWLDEAHVAVRAAGADAALIDAYAAEARFGLACIAGDLARLDSGARVLEVGAGAGLLSMALASAGYDVTALEPMGHGFSHMRRLGELVRRHAATRGVHVTPLDTGAESLPASAGFAFAFSINVMEHVPDVTAALTGIWGALATGASYRFVCPNYRVPFEPHFGIPTLGSKALTWRVFRRRILDSRVVVDPQGTWDSLNWISVSQVRRVCRREFGIEPEFDTGLLARFLARAGGDAEFQRRHGLAMRVLGRMTAAPALQRVATRVPAAWQPAMSCRITKPA